MLATRNPEGPKTYTNKLRNPSKVKVKYQSSDKSVATVNAKGKVTIKGTGTTTIKASFKGNAKYESKETTYTLNVKEVKAPTLTCRAHVENKGTFKVKVAGGKVATEGAANAKGTAVTKTAKNVATQNGRMEAMSLKLGASRYKGGIQYMLHLQGEGWEQGWKADGVLAGTTGQSRRAEAIRVELTGELAEHYDVWYRVHVQTYGWMGWTKNGEGAGTTAQSRRLEAYQVEVLPKGSEAPGATYNSFQGAL